MPLTPAVINKSPRGLLSWLGLKSGGAQPQQLSPTLVPTLDMREWYFETNSQFSLTASVSGAALGIGTFVGVVAPTDFNYIPRFHVQASVPAGTIWSAAPAFITMYDSGVVNACIVGQVGRHSGRAAAELVVAHADRGFFVPPGAAFGFVTTQYEGAGAVNVFGLINFCSIRD